MDNNESSFLKVFGICTVFIVLIIASCQEKVHEKQKEITFAEKGCKQFMQPQSSQILWDCSEIKQKSEK